MGMFGFAKKFIRRTYWELGAEDGLGSFPLEGNGVFVPTYLMVPTKEESATIIQIPQEQWKEAVNG